MRATLAAIVLLLASQVSSAIAAEPTAAQLESRFRDTVRPFLQAHCFECHDKEKHKGDLDLSAYATLDTVAKDYRRWDTVREQLQAGNMPPEKAKVRPKAGERQVVMDWIAAVRRHEAIRHAGDPGPVTQLLVQRHERPKVGCRLGRHEHAPAGHALQIPLAGIERDAQSMIEIGSFCTSGAVPSAGGGLHSLRRSKICFRRATSCGQWVGPRGVVPVPQAASTS